MNGTDSISRTEPVLSFESKLLKFAPGDEERGGVFP